MNNRIVELLQRPQQIQLEDLPLLEKQIQQTPYIQFVRALYLYGVHQHQPEFYKEVLTTTAAYTTDKKILYQFVNQNIEQIAAPVSPAENVHNEPVIEPIKEDVVPEIQAQEIVVVEDEDIKDEFVAPEAAVDKHTEPLNTMDQKDPEIIETPEEVKGHKYRGYQLPANVTLSSPVISEYVTVNGEQNRLLFEGEENFMNEPNTKIDLESTKESGTLVVTEPVLEQSNLSDPIPFVEEVIEDENSHNTEDDIISSVNTIFNEKEEDQKFDDVAIEAPTTEYDLTVPDEEASIETPIEEVITEVVEETPIVEPEIPIAELISEQVTEIDEAESFTHETVIEEDKTVVANAGELSFEAIDEFLPNVKFSVPKNHHTFLNPPKFEKPKPQEIVEPTIASDLTSKEIVDNEEVVTEEVSFHEMMDFGPFNDKETEEPAKVIQKEVSEIEETVAPESESDNIVAVAETIWRPMAIDQHLPDALLGKTETKTSGKEIQPEVIAQSIEAAEIVESQISNKVEEEFNEEKVLEADTPEETRPIMAMSFFSDRLSQTSDVKDEVVEISDKPEEIANPEKKAEAKMEHDLKLSLSGEIDSNVGKFINTWQSWLKIDREDEILEVEAIDVDETIEVAEELTEEIEEKKNKAIEEFIENQPKISQLKDESTFVIKEKKEDISHLMTETLVNLYIEQKLYAKAIKAFEILIGKHPEKKKYFLERIEDVKDLRKPQ